MGPFFVPPFAPRPNQNGQEGARTRGRKTAPHLGPKKGPRNRGLMGSRRHRTSNRKRNCLAQASRTRGKCCQRNRNFLPDGPVSPSAMLSKKGREVWYGHRHPTSTGLRQEAEHTQLGDEAPRPFHE